MVHPRAHLQGQSPGRSMGARRGMCGVWNAAAAAETAPAQMTITRMQEWLREGRMHGWLVGVAASCNLPWVHLSLKGDSALRVHLTECARRGRF